MEILGTIQKALEKRQLSKIGDKSIPLTPLSDQDDERHKKIISQLADKYEIEERDGTTWGFDTVLMRGVHLPSEKLDPKIFLNQTSMENLIETTFSEGMKPNGYMYVDGGGSEYHEDLVIAKRHNWLVSTSFDLYEVADYAAPYVSSTGAIFFIHVPQEAMKKDLFAVNLCGGGKKSVTDGEIGFVYVPPQFILGAVPVTRSGFAGGGGFICTVHDKLFISNPNAKTQVTSFSNLKDYGLDESIHKTVNKGGHIIVRPDNHNPQIEAANNKDKERLGIKPN